MILAFWLGGSPWLVWTSILSGAAVGALFGERGDRGIRGIRGIIRLLEVLQ